MFLPIFFIGMSKNCYPSLKKNLDYLIKFKENTGLDIKICIVDSDSIDGTKDYCKKLEDKNKIDKFIEVDNLEEKYRSRIKRLAISRNQGLTFIKEEINQESLYVPMDMDLNLFSLTSFDNLKSTFKFLIKNDSDCLFPYSVPYYYDIFALRKKGWVKNNNILKSKKIKNQIIFFSFFINYFLIFRKQKHIKKFKQELIGVESAFGGVGMYKVNRELLKTSKYSTNKDNEDMFSEHLFFNQNFDKLNILTKWNIEAPKEYTFFNSYSLNEKLIYILKTIKNDSKNFYNKMKNES